MHCYLYRFKSVGAKQQMKYLNQSIFQFYTEFNVRLNERGKRDSNEEITTREIIINHTVRCLFRFNILVVRSWQIDPAAQ